VKSREDKVPHVAVIFCDTAWGNDVLGNKNQFALLSRVHRYSVGVTVCGAEERNLLLPFVQNFWGNAFA